jgi:hypothetical protein
MPECWNEKKPLCRDSSGYLTKMMQSFNFLVWYQTEIMDVGMPMAALVSPMLMPR